MARHGAVGAGRRRERAGGDGAGAHQIQRLGEASRRYGEAARLSRALYTSGSTSFLEALTAERSLYVADDSLIVSRVAIATSYIALAKALGGGWDGVINSSIPAVIDVNTGPHVVTGESAGVLRQLVNTP